WTLAERVQTQCLFEMPDGEISVSGVQPKQSALIPAMCVAWIYIQSAVNEGDGWIDVWLEVAEDMSREGKDIGVVSSSRKRAARKIDAVLAVPLSILTPTV